jgi:radical SAM superfamily enzyme YgiQ (UPF0313 family)
MTVMLGRSTRQALQASVLVKQTAPGVPVVWGGKLPSIAAAETLRESAVDLVVRGDGEATFNSLVRALDAKTAYQHLPGISYREQETIIHNRMGEPVDLQTLPSLPFGLVAVEKYMPVIGGRRTVNYESSRGCPVRCPYCYNSLEGWQKWRCVPPEGVLRDIRYLAKEHGVEHVYFVDDNLFCDIRRLRQIAEGLIGDGPAVTWDAQGACLEDICAVSREDLLLLKRSGLIRLAVGIQTGSHRIRKLIESRATDEKVIALNRQLKDFGVRPHYYFMAGFPEETADDRRATAGLALRLLGDNPLATTSSFSCFSPWPGTRMFEYARERYGLALPESLEYWMGDWDRSSVPWFSKKEKHELRGLFLASMLYDRKSEWYSSSRIVRLVSRLYRPIARFRLKNMFFSFLGESVFVEAGKMFLKLRQRLR